MRITIYSISIHLVLAIMILACSKESNTVVAHVNGYPISKTEIEYWMLLQRAEVHNFFYRTYGINDSDDFWQQKVEGESPLEMLKKLALQKAVRCKTEQILALEKGTVVQIGFDEIVSKMDGVNKARQNKTENGELIYGPVKYTRRTFFAYEFDKMVFQLKTELLKTELKPSEEQLVQLKMPLDSSINENQRFFEMQFVDENYDAFINRLVAIAEVRINEKNWSNLKADFN